MKCLILAAGRGSRLSSRGDSKPLIPLLGLPLVERVIAGAEKAGFKEFCVVTGYNGDKVRAFLDELQEKRGVRITYVINSEWDRENGLSVLAAESCLKRDNKFALVMADHLFDPSVLSDLKKQKLKKDEVCLVVDYNTENPLIDREDATKVHVEDARIKAINKALKDYNGFDTGIFLCTPAIFSALRTSAERDNDTTLSGAIRVLAEEEKVVAMDMKGRFWIDVDDDMAFEKAEIHLLSSLKKATDGPVSRIINRPISVAITGRIVSKDITPNQISLFCFLLSLIGAMFFGFRGYFPLLLGAIFAQAASIIDGCDGEVARLKFLESEFGGWFDAILDRYADALLLFGLTWHGFITDSSGWTLFAGFMAIVGSFMTSYTADKYDSLMKAKLVKGGAFRIGRDVRVFIIFIGSILNMVLPTLIIIAIIMNIETVRRVIICSKR